VVSISDAQRTPLPTANWIDTVYHGLPANLYKKGEGKGGYVTFIGRISPEKRADRAIEIARQAGMKIKIAAKIDRADEVYFQTEIRHLFKSPHVEYLGEIGETDKADLLADAVAMLFPIDWREPFGMVTIESLACGTPVIAYNRGSVSEIITHGKTGYVVEDIAQAVDALKQINHISREECRASFEKRFTATTMAKNYLRLYDKLVNAHKKELPALSMNE
jgi:glycosyltransferase involved in cell wall biosynthesis